MNWEQQPNYFNTQNRIAGYVDRQTVCWAKSIIWQTVMCGYVCLKHANMCCLPIVLYSLFPYLDIQILCKQWGEQEWHGPRGRGMYTDAYVNVRNILQISLGHNGRLADTPEKCHPALRHRIPNILIIKSGNAYRAFAWKCFRRFRFCVCCNVCF